MKQVDKYHKKAKEIFDKIGLERTSTDFTGIVMHRILVAPEMEKNKILPGLPYYLMAVLFVAGILILTFNDYISDFINDLFFRASNINITFINRFFVSITDLIKGYYISPTVIIIFASSIILLFTMILIDYTSNSHKTLRVQLS
jgi:hypothetical protein